MRKVVEMHGKPRGQRQGSMVIVIFVAVILGTLGVAALTMSSSAGRKDFHQAMRENAFEVAKASAEEAALLINNGKANVEITESMAENALTVEIKDTKMDADTLSYMGIEDGSTPTVKVKAALVSPDMLPRKTPREQLDEIKAEIHKRGYSGSYLAELEKFWEDRVENEGFRDKDTGALKEDFTGAFMAATNGAKVSKWGPLNRKEEEKDADGNPYDPPQYKVVKDKMPALNAVWELFYKHDDADKTSGSKSGHPSPSQLRVAMDGAMQAVGQDASRRMDSCGSNPALAMSHLVGDLETGKAISSGTEVAITTSFLKSKEFGAKTYLLEITSEMPFGKGSAGAKPSVEYTTYRIFQKSEWEGAVENMTKSLICDLRGLGMSPEEISSAWEPMSGTEGRDEVIPDCGMAPTTAHYDPKKVVADPVFTKLPSTVGARMFPYTVANAFTQDAQNKVKTY